MALVTCTECQNPISSNAGACPHCGNPLSRPRERLSEKTQVVEHTAKRFKAMQALFGLLAIMGMGLAVAGLNSEEPNGALVAGGILALLLGLVLFVVARIGAWWYHG